VFLCTVKFHAGIAGNACTDALARYQACHGNSLLAETTIRTASPGGNPFFDITWLAVKLKMLTSKDLALKLSSTAPD